MEEQLIMICDDGEINREMLHFIFERKARVIEATDGDEAIRQIERYREALSLIFLDLVMPNRSGMDVLRYMHYKGYTEHIPVIMITGEATVESDIRSYEYGAVDVIYKPFEPEVVLRRAKNIIELYKHRNEMEQQLEKSRQKLAESNAKLLKNNEFLINALSSVIEFRSMESGEHIHRVKTYAGTLLGYLRWYYPEYGITREQADMMVSASALHDIGKIAIPDEILMKPGKLTAEEFEIMKTHTTKGCEILEHFRQEDNEFYQYCYDICRWHHERIDGSGYPDGLRGDEIPIWAQVVSLVDVYDALLNKRCYKPAIGMNDAAAMILRGECGAFSDQMLHCFELAKHELFDQTHLIESETRAQAI
jgi:putative two-component system response regulator